MEGADFLVKRRYALLADKMGVGKSAQAIYASCKIDEPTLIVAPASAKATWVREIHRVAPGWEVYATTSSKYSIPEDITEFTIINYEQVGYSRHLFRKAGIIVADEIQLLKNGDAQRTQVFHQFLKNSKVGYFWGLSGTPIKNRIPEFYSLLKLLGYCPFNTNGKRLQDRFSSFTAFCKHFCYEERKKFGKTTFTTYVGFRNEKDLHALLHEKYLRRSAEDVGLQLPEERDVFLPVAKISCAEELKDAYARYEASKADPTRTPAKMKAALDKTPFTVSVIRNFLEQDTYPLIVFSDYVVPVEMMAEQFPKSAIISGSVPPHRRAQIVEEFEAGKIPLLFATIGAASTALTLVRSNTMIFNDLPWVPGDLSQAKKRILRIGQTRTCFYYFITTDGGIDEHVMRTIVEKERILNSVYSGFGAIDYSFLE